MAEFREGKVSKSGEEAKLRCKKWESERKQLKGATETGGVHRTAWHVREM